MFSELKNGDITDDFVAKAAEKVLLTNSDTLVWLNHLAEVQRNRKRGASKAAKTRQKKKQRREERPLSTSEQPEEEPEEKCFCPTCGVEYLGESDTAEFWIGCDFCEKWFCAHVKASL